MENLLTLIYDVVTLGAAVEAATSAADPTGELGVKDLGSHIKFGFTQGSNLVTVAEAVKDGDPNKVAAAIGEIAKSSATFAISQYKVEAPKGEKLSDEQKQANAELDNMSKIISNSVDTSVKAVAVGSAAKEGNLDKALEETVNMSKSITGIVEGAGGISKQQKKNIDTGIGMGHSAIKGVKAASKGDAKGVLDATENVARSTVDLIDPENKDVIKEGISATTGGIQAVEAHRRGDTSGVIDGASKAVNSASKAALHAQKTEENSKNTAAALKKPVISKEAKGHLQKAFGGSEPTPEALEKAQANLSQMEKRRDARTVGTRQWSLSSNAGNEYWWGRSGR